MRGVDLPVPALVGAPLTFAVWVLALVTHSGARYVGPLWLAVGLAVFVAVRQTQRRGLLEQVSATELPPGAEFKRILVPLKLGDIGEEMVATAIALAKDSGAEIEAITVVRVPRRYELEGPLPPDVAARVDASLEEAQAARRRARRGGPYRRRPRAVDRVRDRRRGAARGRRISIVLGSSARWRRQSRFFSPTVDFVLRRAPCEVLVVAFPDGVFEE